MHAAQNLMCALKNPAPARPLVIIVTLGNVHKEAMISLAEIFGKVTSPEVLLRVPIKEAYTEKLQ